MKVSPARRAAFEILQRVEAEGAYSSVQLAAADETLNPKDRGLCHELVLGVLRNRLWLDRTLEHFTARTVERLDLPVALALRIGLYQLRILTRIPASAAVNESVNLVRTSRIKSAASLVNAVLRRATREPAYDPTASVTDAIEKLAIETSHPRWLIERWRSQFGEEATAALARANNQPATLALRFTAKIPAKSEARRAKILADLRNAGNELVESKIAPGAWRVEYRAGSSEKAMTGEDAGKQQTAMPALRKMSAEGQVYFQDEASQLVAHLVNAQAGDRVLDICAAPGSKATLMAALAPAASIIAGDVYEHRTHTIQSLAQQQGAEQIHLVVHDATQNLPFPDSSFNRVLVDAPCSGTGTLRPNPEIRWRLQASDISELADKQRKILGHAARAVRPGGLLVYSTCSVETDENEAVIGDFLRQYGDFGRAPMETSSRLQTAAGDTRTWPHRDDVDGFFVSTLQRRK
jgi:16S rRNA (cytosine967-C5)-methyltransferase